MVKIRLQRVGTKNQPKYRLVVASEQTKRSGKALENIGSYDPTIDPPSVIIKKDRYDHWRQTGAQPTKAVIDLVKRYEKASRVHS